MSNRKVSVIVPVYNVEKYLDKCLNCLVNQTYDNLEIIVVNDCSPDNSEEIIKKYCKEYDNIKYIKNEKNSGLSFSRNAGLKESTGDYIGYIDSDDYVDENYYESLVKSLEENKADIAVCDMNIVYENDNTSNRSVCGNDQHDKIDFINNGLAASACNKLFKRKLISKYKFEEGKVNEDIAVIIPIMVNAKKIAYDSNVLYNYIQRENSIQNSSISDKRFDIFYGVEQTLKRIENSSNYEEYKDVIVYNQLIMLFIYVLQKEPSIIRRSKLFKKFNRLSKKYEIRKNKYLWQFLANQGRKHKYYYKLLLKLNCCNLSFLASLLVQFYNILKKFFIKSVIKSDITIDDLIKLAKKQIKMKEKKSISAVIPNYNYEKYLLQRLYSILYQKEKISELIILDDCSKDNSRELIDKIEKELSPYIDIKKIYNEQNSGSAFKQWKKGFEEAKSDYVWIAEADDYCDKNFLKTIIKPIVKDDQVKLSYCDTAFVDKDGNIFLKSIKSEIDIMKTGHWDSSYINEGVNEIENYEFLNCTVANVSSALIKRDDYSKFFDISGEFKQAGDWVFYVNVIRNGKVAYSNNTLNYYRVHGNNVTSVTKKQAHFDEIVRIHEYYDKEFKLNKKQKEEIKKRYKFLKKVWNLK